MTSKTPNAETPVATPVASGIATGSLGTGTAVDDETTLMALPDVPESTAQHEAPALAPAAAQSPQPSASTAAPGQAPAPAPAQPGGTSRRDPYRPIGIALAAILVTLAGLAVLSSGGDAPAQVGAPPAASATPGTVVEANDDEADNDGGNGDGAKGNCNGRGNDPCDRDEGD